MVNEWRHKKLLDNHWCHVTIFNGWYLLMTSFYAHTPYVILNPLIKSFSTVCNMTIFHNINFENTCGVIVMTSLWRHCRETELCISCYTPLKSSQRGKSKSHVEYGHKIASSKAISHWKLSRDTRDYRITFYDVICWPLFYCDFEFSQ